MAWTLAHVYLYTLVFLQAFAFLLCTSTFINHGVIKSMNIESSVRSPIRDKILPAIVERKAMSKRSAEPQNSSPFKTFCSIYKTHVLCTTATDGNSSSRQPWTPHSNGFQVNSAGELLSNLQLSIDIDTSRRHLASDENNTGIDRLFNNGLPRLEERLILSELLRENTNTENIEDRIDIAEEIDTDISQWTNHERSTTKLQENPSTVIIAASNSFNQTTPINPPSTTVTVATASSSSSTSITPTTVTTTSTSAVQTTARINTHTRESHNSGRIRRSGNYCLAEGFCFHGGTCVYDWRLNNSECLCTPEYSGYRCSRREYALNIVDPIQDAILNEYARWSARWKLMHNKPRHKSRFFG